MYDFSTLNDKDFEEIVCDLLSAEHGIIYQSFKEGRDKGIDLRYSTQENENHTVVQVKHYLKSGKATLKSKLKCEEFRKAKRLKVEKYIVVTSIGLSPQDKDDIKDFFQPYINTTNDIYGKDEINTLLGKHDKIETKHFKLWFTNTRILEKIINRGINSRSAFIAGNIKRNIGLFVKTSSYDDALDILQKEKVLLITGIPGIGKTTLSYMLIYKLLGDEYELVDTDNNIKDAEDVIKDNDSKQIFLFDDFLGDTYLEVKEGKNKKINDFISRVRASVNKLIILTTRTTILKQAQHQHEKLHRADFDSNKFELKLENYNHFHKAEILYNHLYFSNISIDRIKLLIDKKRYYSIIEHKNYNPRLLDFITDIKKFESSKFTNYYEFCIYNLNHPEEIWQHPVRKQLNESERYLLFVLFSLGGKYELIKLQKAYEETRNFEIEKDDFDDIYKNLLDGYLKAFQTSEGTIVYFINPSLKDYLTLYFNGENNTKRRRLFSRFKYLEQLENLIRYDQVLKFSIEDWVLIVDNLLLDQIVALNNINSSDLYYRKCFWLTHHIDELENKPIIHKIDEFILSHFRKIDWDMVSSISTNDFEILLILCEFSETQNSYEFLLKNFHHFLKKIMQQINDLFDLDDLFDLEKRYSDIDVFNTIKNHNLVNEYDETLVGIYEYEAERIYYDQYKSIKNEDDLENAQAYIDNLNIKMTDYFIDSGEIYFDYNPFVEEDLNQIIESNSSPEAKISNDENSNIFEKFKNIDDLFNRFNK